MKYAKYHALGNDYIVIDPKTFNKELSQRDIRLICHRRFGVGSDGILFGPVQSESAEFGLRIFNPDGSEAEKSGNGLRIFARSIVDDGFTDKRQFTVETPGGVVHCDVSDDSSVVKVEMGTVSFDSTVIPVTGQPRQVLNEIIEIDGQKLTYCGASVGNPHCVVLVENPSEQIARRFGPLIEHDSRFPHRTNVQFMKVIDRANIRIEIWERGAGYTLASGSSSTAAAAVAHKLGVCDKDISVHMPGGQISIQFDSGFSATMTGAVTKICDGELSEELFVQSENGSSAV